MSTVITVCTIVVLLSVLSVFRDADRAKTTLPWLIVPALLTVSFGLIAGEKFLVSALTIVVALIVLWRVGKVTVGKKLWSRIWGKITKAALKGIGGAFMLLLGTAAWIPGIACTLLLAMYAKLRDRFAQPETGGDEHV